MRKGRHDNAVSNHRSRSCVTCGGEKAWRATLLREDSSLQTVAVDDQSTLYVGSRGHGVWKSADAGESWTDLELPKSEVFSSAEKRQNNLIEQSHRPTRDQERQQRSFRSLRRTQSSLLTHAEANHLFRHTRARTPAPLRCHTGDRALPCGANCHSR